MRYMISAPRWQWFLPAAFVTAVLVGGCSSTEDEAANLRHGAFDVCTQFVEDQLRAPGTAQFRDFFEDDGEVIVTGYDAGPYTVRSTVDSQNGFGALIRSSFTCKVIHKGDGNWRLVDLQFVDGGDSS